MSIDQFGGLCDNFCLFDHHAVLQNEAYHFVKEFEEKRDNLVTSKLHASMITLQELQKDLPEIKELIRIKVGELNMAVIDACKMCEAVSDNGGLIEESSKEDLKRKDFEMINEVTTFDELLKNRAKELDFQLNQELELQKQHYFNIENDRKVSL